MECQWSKIYWKFNDRTEHKNVQSKCVVNDFIIEMHG